MLASKPTSYNVYPRCRAKAASTGIHKSNCACVHSFMCEAVCLCYTWSFFSTLLNTVSQVNSPSDINFFSYIYIGFSRRCIRKIIKLCGTPGINNPYWIEIFLKNVFLWKLMTQNVCAFSLTSQTTHKSIRLCEAVQHEYSSNSRQQR